MNFIKKNLAIISLILIVFSLNAFALSLYFSHFNGPLTFESQEWANFSTYISAFINISSLILIGLISYLAYDYNKKNGELILKPILFVVSKQSQKKPSISSWYVINGSKHAALNILVRYTKLKWGADLWTKWVICSSLAEKQEMELFFIREADIIQVCYKDLSERKIYQTDYSNYMSSTPKLIEEDYYEKCASEAKNCKNNIAVFEDEYFRNPDFNIISSYIAKKIFPKVNKNEKEIVPDEKNLFRSEAITCFIANRKSEQNLWSEKNIMNNIVTEGTTTDTTTIDSDKLNTTATPPTSSLTPLPEDD
jgi:hypothetical protein